MATTKAHHAIVSLMRLFREDCARLKRNDAEFRKLASAYFRGRELLQHQSDLRDRILRTFGILGVHSPGVSEQLARLISPVERNSEDVRANLRLWEILQTFLSGVEQATIADFRSFLRTLNLPVASPQAVDSAVKAHPAVFEVATQGRDKILMLRQAVTDLNSRRSNAEEQ
jgi:hypothetical protein